MSPSRLSEARANPLFWGTVAALALGIAGAASAGGAHLAKSNLVYRVVVGAITFAVVYAIVTVLWHAWHGRTLQKIAVGPAAAEAPDQSTEISNRDTEIQQFMKTTTEVVEDLAQRIEALERRWNG